jgi:hypothetical protein
MRVSRFLADAAVGDSVEVLLFLDETLEVPPFPSGGDPRMRLLREARAHALADSLRAARAPGYAALGAALAAAGARVLEHYWLVPGLRVRAPVGALPALERLAGLAALVPRLSPASAVAITDTATTQGHGAALDGMGFTPYRAAGYTHARVALFDTGLRTTHTLFDAPGRVAGCVDCFQDDLCAATPLPEHIEDAWAAGHGTASASILVGDGSLSDRIDRPELHGVLDGSLTSYRVYALTKRRSTDLEESVDNAVLTRAFQHLATTDCDVLLLEMEMSESDAEGVAVAMLANAAHMAGRVVVAPAGNWGPGALASPGTARRAIAAGYRRIDDPTNPGSQSSGRTTDGRLKPDLQAWTNTFAASNTGDDGVARHTGTSGSAPFVAGAAAVLHAWLTGHGHDPRPGTIDAFLILSGRYDPAVVDHDGAGMIELPSNGFARWGSARMRSCSVLDIPLALDGLGVRRIEAALWWPEAAPVAGGGSGPSQFRLSLVDPDDQVRAVSDLAGSFERADVDASAGGWTLRIEAGCLRTGRRPVYWAVALRR